MAEGLLDSSSVLPALLILSSIPTPNSRPALMDSPFAQQHLPNHSRLPRLLHTQSPASPTSASNPMLSHPCPCSPALAPQGLPSLPKPPPARPELQQHLFSLVPTIPSAPPIATQGCCILLPPLPSAPPQRLLPAPAAASSPGTSSSATLHCNSPPVCHCPEPRTPAQASSDQSSYPEGSHPGPVPGKITQNRRGQVKAYPIICQDFILHQRRRGAIEVQSCYHNEHAVVVHICNHSTHSLHQAHSLYNPSTRKGYDPHCGALPQLLSLHQQEQVPFYVPLGHHIPNTTLVNVKTREGH